MMNKLMTLDGPEANARLDYLLTKARKKRMEKIVKKFQKYVATYSDQILYKTYSDECFVNDMLYGIAIALDKKYEFAQGYKKWKEVLKDIINGASNLFRTTKFPNKVAASEDTGTKPHLVYFELHVDDRTFYVHGMIDAKNSQEALNKLHSIHGKNYHLQLKGCFDSDETREDVIACYLKDSIPKDAFNK